MQRLAGPVLASCGSSHGGIDQRVMPQQDRGAIGAAYVEGTRVGRPPMVYDAGKFEPPLVKAERDRLFLAAMPRTPLHADSHG